MYAPLTRLAHVLSPSHASVFLACRGLATIDQHAARVASALGGDLGARRAELADLEREGLLVPVADLLRRLGATSAPPPPPIASLGIPTRARAASLREALDSQLADAFRHGRRIRSRSPRLPDRGRRIAGTRRRRRDRRPTRGVDCLCRARGEGALRRGRSRSAPASRPRLSPSRSSATSASRSPPAPTATRFCSTPWVSPALQVDDDTRCRPHAASRSPSGPGGDVPRRSRRAVATLAERRSPASAGPRLPRPARGFPRARGRRRRGSPARRPRSRGRRQHAVPSPRGARRAHPRHPDRAPWRLGTGSMAHLFALEGRSRDRLLADEATYRSALLTRRVLRLSPRHAVGDGAACTAAGLGLYARGASCFPSARCSATRMACSEPCCVAAPRRAPRLPALGSR